MTLTEKKKLGTRLLLLLLTPLCLLLAAGFLLAYQFVEPAPPKHVLLATGPAGGAYARFGEEYKSALARHGIELELVSSLGSANNLELLSNAESGVSVAFVQGGTGAGQSESSLVGLGSLYYEPLWIFVRESQATPHATQLEGKRIGVGEVGSGTYAVASQVLPLYGVSADNSDWQQITVAESVEAILSGRLDAVALVSSAESEWVQRLSQAPELKLYAFQRAHALAKRLPFLAPVTLPQGMFSIENDMPPTAVPMVAAAATLVGRNDLHPAIFDLLLQAASEIHSKGGWFEQAREFPSRLFLEVPLSNEADRYYRHGTPFLQRYLPFWAAILLDRLKVMLLPLLTLLIPLIRIFPPLYKWRVRKRIYRWYQDLLELEEGSGDRAARHTRLDALEEEVRKVEVPLSYSQELHNLRLHIEHIRERLAAVEASDSSKSSATVGGSKPL